MERRRSKKMSDINVVPYIDVMLVLLVIFMATAPLLTQGLKIDLPEMKAPVVPQSELIDPLVLTVAEDGTYYMGIGGDDEDSPVSPKVLASTLVKILSARPDTPIFVRGAAKVAYGRVLEALALVQEAGGARASLITVPPDPNTLQ